MIVRANPQHTSYGEPVRARERQYVAAAIQAGYSGREIVKVLRGDKDRLRCIADYLGLKLNVVKPGRRDDPKPRRPRLPLLRRCQVCEEFYGRDRCPCGAL